MMRIGDTKQPIKMSDDIACHGTVLCRNAPIIHCENPETYDALKKKLDTYTNRTKFQENLVSRSEFTMYCRFVNPPLI
jgi:hypothetical protein